MLESLEPVEQWTRKRDVSGVVLHLDQGFQYTSQAYNTRLEEFSVKGSHSRKATCLDNACIESFFSHLKTEKSYLHQCKSEAEIEQAVGENIVGKRTRLNSSQVWKSCLLYFP
ncbi:hypothetical protein E4V51_27350 [Paenibacillus sp. 28ISP30-2]|nr:hypothetical protein [Paenibacillus sp. 28ISP30-2]